jgi:hypothetical protein
VGGPESHFSRFTGRHLAAVLTADESAARFRGDLLSLPGTTTRLGAPVPVHRSCVRLMRAAPSPRGQTGRRVLPGQTDACSLLAHIGLVLNDFAGEDQSVEVVQRGSHGCDAAAAAVDEGGQRALGGRVSFRTPAHEIPRVP